MSAAAPSQAPSQAQRFIQWSLRNIDLLFRLARNLVPVLVVTLKGRTYALVTRFDDVQEVLQRPNVFNVIYAPKLAVIMDGGNIFLGMKDEERATRDKASMRLAAPRAEAVARLKPRTAALAAEILDRAPGRIELAMGLTQPVTTSLYGEYFGTPGHTPQEIADQARLLFGYMFADLFNDPDRRAAAEPVAAALRGYLEGLIAARHEARGRHDDVLERCLQLQDLGTPGMSDAEIRNNLIGFIVGGLPQPPMIIPQLFNVLLDRPAELAAASAAARADDDALVARYVFEALRFYPLTPGLFRNAEEEYRVATGTWRSRRIPRGAFVMAATRSAMMDGRRVPRPDAFRIDRPDHQYMHFGYGMHECFGLYMNRAMVPELCKAVLRLPNLRRAAGPAGQLVLDDDFRIFPTNLVVEFG